MTHKSCKKKLTGYEPWPDREKILEEKRKRRGKQISLGEFENEPKTNRS